jgi:hypothetical protein
LNVEGFEVVKTLLQPDFWVGGLEPSEEGKMHFGKCSMRQSTLLARISMRFLGRLGEFLIIIARVAGWSGDQ